MTSPRTTAGGSLLLTSVTISCAFLMEALDSTVLVAALPAVARDFGVQPLQVNMAVTIYLITLAAMIPASAWMADRFGARRVFLWAIAGFALASVGAATAQNLPGLVAMRVLQATAGAMMTPVGRLLLIRAAPKDHLTTAIAWMSMPSLIGPVMGPLLAGWIVTHGSWRWIFLINLPIALVGLIVAARVLPRDEPLPPRPFDLRGFLICVALLAGLQLGLDQLVHPFLPGLANLGLALVLPLAALAYALHQARVAAPVLDLTLLRHRLFRVGLLAGGLSRLGLNAVPFLLQIQLQLGFGWSAARAGTTVFAVAAGALVLKPLMRRVLAWLGFRRTLFWNAMAGGLLTAALALVNPATPQAVILAVVLLYGVSRSLQFNTINALIFAEVPGDRQSASTALGGVGQQLSMALGISVAAILVAQFQTLGLAPGHHAIALAFAAMAALTALSALAFLTTLREGDGAAVSRHRPKSA